MSEKNNIFNNPLNVLCCRLFRLLEYQRSFHMNRFQRNKLGYTCVNIVQKRKKKIFDCLSCLFTSATTVICVLFLINVKILLIQIFSTLPTFHLTFNKLDRFDRAPLQKKEMYAHFRYIEPSSSDSVTVEEKL